MKSRGNKLDKLRKTYENEMQNEHGQSLKIEPKVTTGDKKNIKK